MTFHHARRATGIAAVAAVMAFPVWALSGDAAKTSKAKQTETSGTHRDLTHWNEIRDKTVSASALMRSEVTNGLNPVGSVRDLVLDKDSTTVQYVLYEVPFPYNLYSVDDGFVEFARTSVDSLGWYGLRIRFDDAASGQAPERLALTRSQADHRLVSNLLGDSVAFDAEGTRQIEDLLIDRRTGRITHFVVNKNPEALFNEHPSAIPAREVSISATGDVTTTLDFEDLEPIG